MPRSFLLSLIGYLLLAELSQPVMAAAPPTVRRDQYGDILPAGAVARFGTVRLRPLLGVVALRFSLDGRALLALEGDGAISRWSASTGQLVEEAVAAVGTPAVFSADERLVGSEGVSPRTWFPEVERGDLPTAINGIRLWDTRANKELRLFQGHTGKLHRLALSPDGKHLVSAACDGTVRVWVTATGKELHRFQVPRNGWGRPVVDDLAVPSGGKTVIVSMSEDQAGRRGEEKGVRFYEAATGRWQVKLPDRTVCGLLLSPDGATLAVHSTAGIHLLDMHRGNLLRTLVNPGRGVMTFSGDGKTLAAADIWSVRVWDTNSGKLRREIETRGHVLALSGDGSHLAAWKEGDRIRLWETSTGKELLGGKVVRIAAAAFNPDGRELALTGGRTIRFHDTTTAAEQRAIPGPSRQVERLAYSPDGRLLAVMDGWQIHLIESKTGKSVRDVSGRVRALRAYFSPDGKLLAIRELDCTTLLETATGKVLWGIAAGAPRGGSPAFSPDGKVLVAYKPRRWLGCWDVGTGKDLPHWQDNRSPPLTAVFSTDGKTLTAACHRGVIASWRVSDGKLLHRASFPWRKSAKWEGIQAALSPDGKFLAIAWSDEPSTRLFPPPSTIGRMEGRIWLYETATGKEVRRFDGHRGWVTSLTFSPDGRRLLSTSTDGVAIVWRCVANGG